MENRFIKFMALIFILCVCSGLCPVYAQDNIDAYFTDEEYDGAEYYRTVTRTKKGIQEAYSYSEEYKDLGISHTLVNVCLNQLLDGSIAYNYHGKTYYFDYIPNLSPYDVSEFNENDVCVTAVLLMQMDYRSLRDNLIYPGAALDNTKKYYGWNVYDERAAEEMSALLDFLASAYGRSDCHIDNWVVGNEVNMPNHWNYTGTTDVNVNADIYARQFVMVNNAIKRYNAGAKAYISLDHSWTHNDEGRGIAGKTFLDAFAARILEISPEIDWNIAFHLYSPIMVQSNIWSSFNARYYAPQDIGAAFICARNLDVLTEYVKNTYGQKVRIILSEQGFTMYNGQEAAQAAALAYTYYAAEFNDMVDATMFRSLYDSPAEMKDRFYFGLLNSDRTKRAAYDVFKYMDTSEWESYTRGCLDTMDISLWNEVVTYFDGEKFADRPLEKVILEKSGTVVAAGYKETLRYEVYPEFASMKGVIWSSSDENVLHVDANSGEMTGIMPGRAIVTISGNDTEYEDCIVVVKDAAESRANVSEFVKEVYRAVNQKEISETDLNSYTERLMTKNMTGADVAYEIISGRCAMTPVNDNTEYVRMLYRALLNADDSEIPEDELNMYVLCLEGGMDREKVLADLIGRSTFDYRCYDHDINTGKQSDIYALRDINMSSYNRDASVTYSIVRIFDIMLARMPEKDELKGLCSKLLSEKITEDELMDTVYNSKEFKNRHLSAEGYVDMLYKLCGYENVNIYVRNMTVNLVKTGKVTRATVYKAFMEGCLGNGN